MKGEEDSERGREYWLTCNTESGGGRDPANIKYIITFILISLLAPVCLCFAHLPVAMDPNAKRARTSNSASSYFSFPPPSPPASFSSSTSESSSFEHARHARAHIVCIFFFPPPLLHHSPSRVNHEMLRSLAAYVFPLSLFLSRSLQRLPFCTNLIPISTWAKY